MQPGQMEFRGKHWRVVFRWRGGDGIRNTSLKSCAPLFCWYLRLKLGDRSPLHLGALVS